MYDDNYLEHYGVRGQKWGVRRYQNEDGSLTQEGRQRYLQDTTGRFNRIKDILTRKTNQAAEGVKKNASNQKDSFVRKHKPTSMMSDQELRENLNRLNMERQYKQAKNELSGKKPKQTFAQKHPILQQIVVSSATSVAADFTKDFLQTRVDEIVAPKRLERAKRTGILDEELGPFLSPRNQARNVNWNRWNKSNPHP